MIKNQNESADEMTGAISPEPPGPRVCPIKSKIGGQALIEGVMMRGLDKAAMAVRLPGGGIDVEEWPLVTGKFMRVITKIPIVRGVFSFVSSMVTGFQCLSKSAEKAGMLEDDGEAEMSRFEKWLDKTFGENLMKFITGVGTVLGVIMAVVLFVFIPTLVVKGLDMLIPLGWTKGLIEGLIKIIIFVTYLAFVSRMKEIKRVFEYHGAEHKTIFCYEKGLDLTVGNVGKQSRFHPRCGTSFLILIRCV